jgi:RimJ/RimL family protein N-acetyltransferase
MVEIPTLRTERLVLRPFREEDLDPWAAILADPEIARHIGGVRSREEAWRTIATYLGHWMLRGYGQWAVERRLDGRFIGRAGLWFPEGWPELEVGWTLDRAVWGEGFATEAGQAAIEWGFAELGLMRIASVIAPDNARSRAVAVRLGMDLDREVELEGRPVVVYARDRPVRGAYSPA